MTKARLIATAAMIGTTAFTAGCGKGEPAGQVAAVVNGKEITLQEINAELQASNLPQSVDKTVAQRELLQRIIERKLIVGAAEEKGIDKTPDYQAQKRRADELLLAQLYAKQQLAAVPVPNSADIAKFMADHRNAFASREALTLDQIRFPTPPDVAKLKILEKDHSLEAVAQTLTGMKTQYERSQVGLDTGTVPSEIMNKINALPPGEPFVIPQQGFMTVNVILSRRPLPYDESKSRPAAVGAWRQDQFGQLLTRQVEALKAGAKISYQNGFGPPPPSPAAAPKPPAAPKP